MRAILILLFACATVAVPAAQDNLPDPTRGKFDQILDAYVRDGWVYYRALKLERGRLDSYVAQLGTTDTQSMSRDEREAFWLNAYNALVLRTVVDHYPIQGHAPDYPAHSIRQIPGAFERLPHRVAGRQLTLDQIEKSVLPEFNDPRVYLALGRGALGGGRLRSEAFIATRLDAQLSEVAAECASRPECVQLDRANNKLLASPVFSWHDQEFVDRYALTAPEAVSNRSPIERAIVAFVEPKLLTTEREFIVQNMFQVSFKPFDWSLNDLTGRGGR